MKLLTHALPAALFTTLLCLSSLSYADDTEIYFARANADNEENRAVANVLIMLDTSGSMRFCQNELSGGSGYNASWCTNAANRRINILQNALDQLLDSVSPAVRIGIGRYNYIAPNTNSGSCPCIFRGRALHDGHAACLWHRRQWRSEFRMRRRRGSGNQLP